MSKSLIVADLQVWGLFPHPKTGELQPVERIYVMTDFGITSYYQAGPFADGMIALQFSTEPPAEIIIEQLSGMASHRSV